MWRTCSRRNSSAFWGAGFDTPALTAHRREPWNIKQPVLDAIRSFIDEMQDIHTEVRRPCVRGGCEGVG